MSQKTASDLKKQHFLDFFFVSQATFCPIILSMPLKRLIINSFKITDMKTNKIILGAILASSLIIFSCKKDKGGFADPVRPEDPSTSFNMNDKQKLLRDLATPAETFVINTNAVSTISGSKGTQIVISPSAFVTISNQPVTGNITIKLKEALTKKDMILNNAVPVSNKNLLVSGGEIYLSAWQNGQQLKKNPAFNGINVNIPISGSPASQMALFYANGDEDLSNDTLNWTPSNDTVSVYQDTSSAGPYYSFYPDSLNTGSFNWANCDYFWNDPNPKTSLTFTLTGQFDNTNTAIYLSLNGNNVLMQAYPNSYSSLTQGFSAYNIPINNNFTLVCISYVGGNYYYYSMPITSSTNLGVTIPALTLSSLSQINNNLNSLP